MRISSRRRGSNGRSSVPKVFEAESIQSARQVRSVYKCVHMYLQRSESAFQRVLTISVVAPASKNARSVRFGVAGVASTSTSSSDKPRRLRRCRVDFRFTRETIEQVPAGCAYRHRALRRLRPALRSAIATSSFKDGQFLASAAGGTSVTATLSRNLHDIDSVSLSEHADRIRTDCCLAGPGIIHVVLRAPNQEPGCASESAS